MSNEIVVAQEKSYKDVVKDMYFKGATDAEFETFMMLCKKTNLDPIARQIYVTKMQGKLTTLISIDGFRLVADRTGRYAPGREPTYTYDKNGKLYSATSYVKKLTNDGSWHEVAASALWSEYGKGNGNWLTMPHVMLAKCAESQALRRAFPNDLSGLYTKEEMDQAEWEEVKKKPQLMTKPDPLNAPTIEVQEVPKIEQKPRTIDDLYEASMDAGAIVDVVSLGNYVRFLRDKRNEKGDKVVDEAYIIGAAFLPDQMARFVKGLNQYLDDLLVGENSAIPQV